MMRLIRQLHPDLSDRQVAAEALAVLPAGAGSADELEIEAAGLRGPATELRVALAASAADAVTPGWAKIGTVPSSMPSLADAGEGFMPGAPSLTAHAERAAHEAGLAPDVSMFPGRGHLGVS
ncbi:hypothetical protein NBH00_14870 [Paraconexibacter antarcticus]|uniref:Uncharacterized protein n=1 Tax=Paraconexibacter antarcticus TaxID=2949664 RepID=A0ABY5DPJ4_9ACTN|nr:hypothetical protein [Paraconexibacter antarcticus]UTI62640.1 hypothetical protein NBH00_14870 [Paraconexibacter antarcticus]